MSAFHRSALRVHALQLAARRAQRRIGLHDLPPRLDALVGARRLGLVRRVHLRASRRPKSSRRASPWPPPTRRVADFLPRVGLRLLRLLLGLRFGRRRGLARLRRRGRQIFRLLLARLVRRLVRLGARFFFLPLPLAGASFAGVVRRRLARHRRRRRRRSRPPPACRRAVAARLRSTSAAISALARCCAAGLTAPSESRMNACSSSDSGLMRCTRSK